MKTLGELETIQQLTLAKLHPTDGTIRVVVGMATCGIAAGAGKIIQAMNDEVQRRGLKQVVVSQTGCIGMCRLEPMMDVFIPGQPKVTYVKLKPEMCSRIVAEHIVNGRPVREYTVGRHEEAK